MWQYFLKFETLPQILSMTKRRMSIFLALLVIVSFFNCLQNDFIGDDKALFTDNQFYKSLKDLPRILTRDFVMDPSRLMSMSGKEISFSGVVSYRPVPGATFFIDYAIWHDKPFGHHLTNIVYHFLATLLVFYLAFFLTGKDSLAFFAAVLFATHPVQSEVVNSIGYRSDLLMTLFYLAAILAYCRGVTQKKTAWLLGAGIFYALSLFSKESAVMFLPMIVLLDRFFLCPQQAGQLFSRRKWAYLGFGLVTMAYSYIYFFVMPNIFYPHSIDISAGLLQRLVVIFKIFANYVMVLVLPFKITVLPPLYSPPIFPLRLWEVFVPVLAVVGSGASAVYFYRRNKVVTFGILWFFVNYLPVSGLAPLLNPFAFRFLYLPSIGFFLLAALAIENIIGRIDQRKFSMNVGRLLKIALVGLNVSLTIANNGFFKSDFVACHEMVRRYPDSSRPYWILGLNYYNAGNFKEAAKYFEKHLQAGANNPFISDDKEKFLTYHFLGRASQDPDKAIVYLNKARDRYPSAAILLLDLSKNYIIKKDYPAAIRYAEEAIKSGPPFAIAYVYIIHSHIAAGELPQARKVLGQAKAIWGEDANLKAVETYLKRKEAGR